MKEITLTCPFTGVEFSALEMADGKLIVIHPLTGEQIQVNWNCSINRYNLPKSAFKHIETLSREQAQTVLNVSHQRITQIIKDETIPVHYANGQPVFVASDVYHYRDTRKVGAPRKTDK